MAEAVFLCNAPEWVERVYGLGRREKLGRSISLYPQVVGKGDFEAHEDALRDVRYAFSTWGLDEELAKKALRLPRLEAVFYAAGSVQGFARPFLEKGLTVMSAWGANAVPVAQFTLAQILLSLKGYYQNLARRKRPENRGQWIKHEAPGVFREPVALLGCGMIGSLVVEFLQPFTREILVFDPFLSEAKRAALGVTQVSLEEAFRQGMVVSNHLANLPETVGMLKGSHFASMRQGATFINTGRGATVAEEEMTAVLAERGDIAALLDVTFPEPPKADSPLYTLDNVFLSSHIAGSIGDEVVRMADYALEEFEAFRAGKPLRYGVSADMLSHMA